MKPIRGLVLPLILAACSPWPQAGQGGFAERDANPDSKPIACATARLAELERLGETRRKPAETVAARLLLQRILREQAGGLVEEAERDLAGLDATLARLGAGQEARLKSSEGCPS